MDSREHESMRDALELELCHRRGCLESIALTDDGRDKFTALDGDVAFCSEGCRERWLEDRNEAAAEAMTEMLMNQGCSGDHARSLIAWNEKQPRRGA